MSSTSLISFITFLFLTIIQIYEISSIEFGKSTLLYHKNFILFEFPDKNLENEYITNMYYQNVTFNNIKIGSKGQIFLTFPRYKENVPITLGKYDSKNEKIKAFPTWENNHCTDSIYCLYNVNAIEIDTHNKMWIIDSGINNKVNSSMKLVIYDLKKKQFIYSYVFKDNEDVFYNSSLLSDIAIDTENEIIYISDSGIIDLKKDKNFHPGIILFDKDTENTKRVLSKSIFSSIKNNNKICPNRPELTIPWGVNGITLTCERETIYFSSLNSRELYEIKTELLLMYNDNDYINSSVKIKDKIQSYEMGIIASSKHLLFSSGIEDKTIYYFNNRKKELGWNILFYSNNMTFPTKFAYYNRHLYVISNSFCEFLSDEMDYDNEYNYEIWKIYVNANSYIHGCDFIGYRFGVSEVLAIIFVSLILCFCMVFVIVAEFLIRRIRTKNSLMSYTKL